MSDLIDGLPAALYTDPAIYQAERKTVFAGSWLYAAHLSEFEAAGDYQSTEIAGHPLLLVKQADQTVKCFHNICSHRGAPLVTDERGSAKAGTFTCKYHGWSYGCQGELLSAPYLESLPACTKTELSLHGVPTWTYNNMVFVKLAGAAKDSDFQKEHADLIATIAASDCDFENYAFHSKMVREGNFNWKVWIEGYQECYHCPTIHPVFNKDFKLQNYKIENRQLFSNHSCERKTTSSSGAFNGLWLWVFPNLGMPVYEPCFYTLQVNPVGVSRTVLTYTFHRRTGTDDKTMNDFRAFVDQITEEDITVCQAVQHNLESGLIEKTRVNSVRENGVAYFHALIRGHLGMNPAAQAPGVVNYKEAIGVM